MSTQVLDEPKVDDLTAVEFNEPVYFDIPREVVCSLMSHLEDAPYPAPKTTVKYDPLIPDRLNYRSFSIGQTEEERQWDGLIPLSECNRRYVQSYIDTALQKQSMGLNP